MSEKTKTDALAGLARFLTSPRQVSINGTKYGLAKLRPIDLANGRDYVVQRRIERHVETTRYMNFEPIVRAKALAEIECAPLSLYDVMQDPDGRLKLLFSSLTRGGTSITLEDLRQKLDPIEADEIYAYVLWISGVIKEPDITGDPAGPLGTSATTPSDGT